MYNNTSNIHKNVFQSLASLSETLTALELLESKIYGIQGGGRGGTDWEVEINMYTLLYLK